MIHHEIYNTIDDVCTDWDKLASKDVFLQSHYLKALEASSPNNITMFYIGIFKDADFVGLALIQRVQLYLKDMFRDTKVSCLKTFLKENISKVLKGNILVVGNMTHTGQHGMSFDTQKLTVSEFYDEIFKGVSELEHRIKKDQGKKIRLVMLKDFFVEDKLGQPELFQEEELHKVTVQPNMVMDVWDNWRTYQDYISCMNKKYRARYKRARKKLNSIICKEMDLEAIRDNSKLLHQLYLNVSNNAKFNTFVLPEDHFYTFKVHLKEKFKVFGYYLHGELIGFYTLILNNDALETYFLGYDTKHQYPNQLYLNMLYDMAKFGIENKFKYVVYARTAMEIKSSVGAKPEPMVIYLKHTNNVLNGVLKQVFRLMNPSQDWEERHPFAKQPVELKMPDVTSSIAP